MHGETLASWLSALAGYSVVGIVSTGPCLLQLCVLRAPDIALLRTKAADDEELALVRKLRADHPGLRVIGLQYPFDPQESLRLHHAGVHRLVSLRSDLSVLFAALEDLRQHGEFANRRPRLTDRELEVLALVCGGYSVERIAPVLNISPHTVANFKRRIFAKLEVQSRTQAAVEAERLGLLRVGTPSPERGGPPSLTSRDRDILASIARGESVRQTANALGIAMKTVQSEQRNLFFKLGVANRAEALFRARALGLVDDC
ncbi:response regulator transcription factor [Solihabitans fulvus]|nr:LuxR family transcriptional regulator [Solihabitans fulvus]